LGGKHGSWSEPPSLHRGHKKGCSEGGAYRSNDFGNIARKNQSRGERCSRSRGNIVLGEGLAAGQDCIKVSRKRSRPLCAALSSGANSNTRHAKKRCPPERNQLPIRTVGTSSGAKLQIGKGEGACPKLVKVRPRKNQ